MKCRKCGVELAVGAKFCRRCGTAIPPPVPEPTIGASPEKLTQPALAAAQTCPACGATIKLGKRFCGSCGAALLSTTRSSAPKNPEPPPLVAEKTPLTTTPPSAVSGSIPKASTASAATLDKREPVASSPRPVRRIAEPTAPSAPRSGKVLWVAVSVAVVIAVTAIRSFLYLRNGEKKPIISQTTHATMKTASNTASIAPPPKTPVDANQQGQSLEEKPFVQTSPNPQVPPVRRNQAVPEQARLSQAFQQGKEERQNEALRQQQQDQQAQQRLFQQAQALQQERAQIEQQREALQRQQQALQQENSRLQTQVAAPNPAPVAPRPYSGPSSGTIIWQGEVHGMQLIDINGDRAEQGAVTGELPGVPCMVQPADPKHVSVAIAPGVSNAWNRIVVRVQGKGRVTVRLNWSIL